MQSSREKPMSKEKEPEGRQDAPLAAKETKNARDARERRELRERLSGLTASS